MNWKATVAVSGATLLAGWIASAPPAPTTPSAVPSSSQSPRTAAAGSDISELAARLQTRPRQDAGYGEPERNLFRFGPNRPVRSEAPEPIVSAPPPLEILPQAPPPLPISLSGVASDSEGERTVRTAILSSPGGVLLVKEGEEVLGQYRVGAIGEDSVELTRLSDGTALRITLKP
ncbi:MAG: hypothetical protein EXQ59_06060 [Acidobacteria bacterium]|nr:hypothetical protein [Acidobacteriota bacterium]